MKKDDMIMPFGKYVDQDIREIPSDYLSWLVDEDWFEEKFEDLYQRIEEELKIRDRSYGHFYSKRYKKD